MNERPAPVEPAELTDHIRNATEMVAPTVAEIDAEWFAAWSEETGRYDVVQFARSLLAKFGQQLTPPAEGEVGKLADLARCISVEESSILGCVEEWASRLEEGTPEERLLGRVAAVLRQRQAPPGEGEVDALIKVLSRIAGMLDFMPDGPPNGLVIHRAIELLRQLTPPAEGEVGKLVAALKGDAACIEAGQHDLCSSTADQLTRAADLLQQQAADLAPQRRQAGPPAEGEVGELVDFLETLGSDYDGPLPPRESITLFRAADLLQQQAAELTALRRLLVPTPPAEGEVGELARILKDVSGDYDDDSYPPSSESKQILRAAELLQEQAAELATLRQERTHA